MGFPKGIKYLQIKIRLVTKTLRKLVITEYHYTPMEGHAGVHKTD